jgi:hypothetical protein
MTAFLEDEAVHSSRRNRRLLEKRDEFAATLS